MCQICSGSGWIFENDGKTARAVRCKCQFKKFSRAYLEAAKIPPRYRNCKFSNYIPETEYQVLALKECKNFFYLYPFVEKGLLLYGPPGTGKTHLAVALLKNVIKYKGLRGLFCDFRELLLTLKSTYGSNESEFEVLKPVVDAPLLVLDDVGAERGTEWAKEKLALIINYRYTKRLPTVITTNLCFDGGFEESFSSRFDTRTESRIYEMCRIVRVEGNDKRKETRI